jgi:hypothetical protein
MAIPAKPVISDFPPAPKRGEPRAQFTPKSNALVAHYPVFVAEQNAAIDWQDLVYTAVVAEKDEATAQANRAESEADDSQASRIASESARDLAEGYRDQSAATLSSNQAIAAAVQSAAGLPSLVGNAGKALTVSGDETTADWAPAGIAMYQEFTTSGSFTKHPLAKFVRVELIGGGASGGCNSITSFAAAGGGGGGYASQIFVADTLPASVAVTVGAGGASNVYTGGDPDVSGNDGGASSFGSLLVARGGLGAVTSGADGGGGERDSGYNQNPVPGGGYSSGAGGYRLAKGGNCVMGGAGGGAAGNNGQDGGISQNGGNGGKGGSGGGNASAGQFPGGGGGGYTDTVTSRTGLSGAGADGVVRIWQW